MPVALEEAIYIDDQYQINLIFRTVAIMKKLILLLLVSGAVWAQQPAQNEYTFDEFMLIEKLEDQVKYYNEMLEDLPADKVTPEATNDYRAELAYGWLAKGNVEKYRQYKATNPNFNPRQFLYLCNALEKLADVDKQYAAVEEISRELLNDLEKGTLSDPMGRTPVLMELNAVSNAVLGNIDVAKEMIAKSTQEANGSRDVRYFKDTKANYLNRHAIILSAAGEHQAALDMLSKALRDADSNPNMDATFREVYRKAKGTNEGCEQYIESLRAEAYRKYYQEVEQSYIATPQMTLDGTVPDPASSGETMTLFRATQPVHDVSLPDLEGRPVDLGDYKGKVLALDFWSTLCTPCVSAFAGFERVVADYSKDEFQMFVVGLFEGAAIVKPYVAKKGINLDVLTDDENQSYDIRGTPTKIVFDPNGNIRFYGAGYAGSTDREYYKLKAMVEITQARAGS